MRKLIIPSIMLLFTCLSFEMYAQNEKIGEDKSERVWTEHIYGAVTGGVDMVFMNNDFSQPLNLNGHFAFGINKPPFYYINMKSSLFQQIPMFEPGRSLNLKTANISVSTSDSPDEKQTLFITSEDLTAQSKNIEITALAGDKMFFDSNDVVFNPETHQLEIKLFIEKGYYTFTIPTASGEINQLAWISLK